MRFRTLLSLPTLLAVGITTLPAQQQQPDVRVIPKTWDDAEIGRHEVPLASPIASPKHVSSDYYYRIPVRPIYKSYPVYAPGHEPSGYFDHLTHQEPEVVWGTDKNGVEHAPPLQSKADWIRAGEIVFDAAIVYDGITT